MDINENTISFNENENKNKEVKNAVSNDKLWKKVTFGTASGILLGAGAIFAVNRIGQDDAPEVAEKLAAAPQNAQEEVAQEEVAEEAAEATETAAVESDATIYDQAPVAEVSDKLSFDDAFAQARAEVGPGGVFAWHKGIYGTYYTDEWDAMSDDQKAEFVQSVNPEVRANLVDTDNISEENPDIIIADDNNEEVAEETEEVAEDNEEVAEDTEEVADETEEVAEDNEEVAEDNEEVAEDNEEVAEETEEEAAGEEVAEGENTTFEDEVSELEDVHIVGRTELEGHEALSLDMDGDDKSDVVVIDADDSGNVSADDMLAFSDGSIMTVEEYMNSDYEPGANGTDESVVVVDEVETEENVVDTPVETPEGGDLTEEILGDDSMDMASMEDPDDPDSELNEFIDAVDDITTV